MKEVCGGIPRGRIALETGMPLPWVRKLGNRVIMAHARKARVIGESRRKDDRFDAGVTDKTRSSWASPLAKEREIENAPDVRRLSSVGKPTDRNLLHSRRDPLAVVLFHYFTKVSDFVSPSPRRRLYFVL